MCLIWPLPGSVFEILSFYLPWPGSVFENLSFFFSSARFCVQKYDFLFPRPDSMFENLSLISSAMLYVRKSEVFFALVRLCVRKTDFFPRSGSVFENLSFLFCPGQAICSKI